MEVTPDKNPARGRGAHQGEAQQVPGSQSSVRTTASVWFVAATRVVLLDLSERDPPLDFNKKVYGHPCVSCPPQKLPDHREGLGTTPDHWFSLLLCELFLFFLHIFFVLFCVFLFFSFFSLLIIFVCLFVKVQPPPQDDRELFDDDQKPNVLGWIAQLNPQAAAVAVAAAAPAAAPNVDGIHDIPKFFVDTKLCVAPMGFTPARQKFLLAKSEEDQDTAILKVISTWWKAAHENVVADGFWRYGHLFHPLKLSSFQALKLSTCVSFFKMCHSHRDLQDLNAYEEGGQHGYFNVVEITAPYLRDLVRLVLFLVRMASDFHDDTEVEEDFVPAKLPEDIRNAATSLSLEPTIVKLQQLLQLLFLPLPTRHARDGHPTALFVHLSVRDADGTLKSVDYISHLSVHLLYSARLATFQQLRTDNPETEEERTTMLKSVKLT